MERLKLVRRFKILGMQLTGLALGMGCYFMGKAGVWPLGVLYLLAFWYASLGVVLDRTWK